jgi:hypothetical protein
MKDRVVAWPATAADYYMHHYLAFNPTKDEYDVNRAKQAELRDGKLQAAVKARDLNLCRYCGARVVWADRRSSLGGVFDHVDPNLAAGAANLVVACRGCNSRKGHRTPDAAGMTLLAVPGAVTGDPGDDLGDDLGGDLPPTTRSGLDPTTHPPVRDGTGRADVGRAVGDAGPNGDRPTTGPPAGGPRRSQHPNPYHRSAITGADPNLTAGLPSPMDYDQADRELFDEYNNSREDDP